MVWNQFDSEYNWNFSNLQEAFEKEDGVLHEKNVYLVAYSELQLVYFHDIQAITSIPVVVAIVSPIPPSDKIVINSIQMKYEEIHDMKKMNLEWAPYVPLGKRGSSVETLKSQIFILSCVKNSDGLRRMNPDDVKKIEYYSPYVYNPFKEDEIEKGTTVAIMYTIEPKHINCFLDLLYGLCRKMRKMINQRAKLDKKTVVWEYDWEMDELEEFTKKRIDNKELPEDHKDAFKEFVKEKVREGTRAKLQAREKRKKAQETLNQEEIAAFKSMRFYKFYPVATPDTPDISNLKV
ncbi:heat intolerant 4-like protein [Tanacetum coccineum]